MKYLVETLPNIGVTLVSVDSESGALLVNSDGLQLKQGDTLAKIGIDSLKYGLEPCSLDMNGSYVRLKHSKNGQRRSRDVSVVDLPEDKWSLAAFKASAATHNFKLLCRNCQNNAILDSRNGISKVNEMPSEFWAEFMDFWHCHKPSLEEANNNVMNVDTKYIDLRPRSGELLIGNTFFQVIKGTLVPGNTIAANSFIKCGSCKCNIGTYDESKDIVTLNKRKLILDKGLDEKEYYDSYMEVLAGIITLLKFNSARYFKVISPTGNTLFLWLFAYNVDVFYSPDKYCTNCYKILYRNELEKSMPNIEDITIKDQEVFDDFKRKLFEVNSNLPRQSREFCQWSVAYISIDG